MELRPYQKDCIEAIISFIINGTGNAIISAECASGKSILLARTAEFLHNIGCRVLIVADRSKLLIQNHAKFQDVSNVGLVSSGLNKEEYGRAITVGGIQTIYNKIDKLGKKDWILIDECESYEKELPDTKPENLTMYQKLVNAYPEARIIGMSATPFRTDSGKLGWGEIIYEIDYATLLKGGYVVPFTSKILDQPNLTDVTIRGGEYAKEELEKIFNVPELVKKSCDFWINYAIRAGRKRILVFAISKDHADNIARYSIANKITSVFIGASTPEDEREHYYKWFENEDNEEKALINIDLLTKGADFPCIDMIVCFRSTMSLRWWRQMKGRGARLFKGKKDCVMLDFSGNIVVFGGLDEKIDLRIKDKKEKQKKKTKECPSCQEAVPIAKMACPSCDYVFETQEREIRHEEKPFLEGEGREYEVEEIYYNKHLKEGKPPTLRVAYYTKGRADPFHEYIAFESESGFAKKRAYKWLLKRGQDKFPITVDEVLKLSLLKPTHITIKKQVDNPKFFDVVDCRF
jgi:DNA repair protein RadD